MAAPKPTSLSFAEFIALMLKYLKDRSWKEQELKDFEAKIAEKGGEFSFIKDGKLDSLDSVEFVMFLEEEISVEIPDSALESVDNAGQFYGAVCKSLGTAPDAKLTYAHAA